MSVYLGVDFHARTQTVCWCDQADGVLHQRTLDHQQDDVRGFYTQFAAPATFTPWNLSHDLIARGASPPIAALTLAKLPAGILCVWDTSPSKATVCSAIYSSKLHTG